MVSRNIKWHAKYKTRLEELGFQNAVVTGLEKDALDMLIREMKPSQIIMGARFYECSTPFKLGELKRRYPKINMAALAIDGYPADLAMYFILNGAKEYVDFYDGPEIWYEGLDCVKSGKEFISPSVMESIEMRNEYPKAAGRITNRQREVIRLICNGFEEKEIADNMQISVRSVASFKRDIFTSLNVRNCLELMRAALYLEIVSEKEIYFMPRGLILSPKPTKQTRRKEA